MRSLLVAVDAEGSRTLRGEPTESRLDAPCPLCGRQGIHFRSVPLDLPYFGEALQTTILCEGCGYRHADVMLLRDREPRRVVLAVLRPDHLSARVARSSAGTIRIPELGATLEPGPRAEAFVSNVEGVLHRFRDAAKAARALAGTDRERAEADAALARIEDCIEGRMAFTFILEDPTGNSDVFHKDAVRRRLTPEEIAELKSPYATLDLADLMPKDEASS